MERIALTLLILASLYASPFAQEFRMPLYPEGQIPYAKKSKDVEKSDSSEMVRISKVQVPDIAVYLPTKRNATGQAMIICPGGGYAILAYDWEGTDVAKWLNANGIAAIVLKYRLPDNGSSLLSHLTPLTDATRAMRLVRFNAARWSIKPDKIGIMGFSAGGHLASTLATHFDAGHATAADPVERISSRPDFMSLIYPVITLAGPFTHEGSKHNLLGKGPDTALIRFYSNEQQVTRRTPPTFLVHASDDKAVPVENSLMFYQALIKNDVPAEMHIYPKGGHGFGLGIGVTNTDSWPERCIGWLRTLN